MARIIRDYLDPEQIGQVVEITVTHDNAPSTTAAGRMLFYAEDGPVTAVQFEGGELCVLRFDSWEEFIVSYDPNQI